MDVGSPLGDGEIEKAVGVGDDVADILTDFVREELFRVFFFVEHGSSWVTFVPL